MNRFLAFGLGIFLLSCGAGETTINADVNFGSLPVYSENGHVQMVVEIPAGTNKKLEYNNDNNSFPADIKDGKERVVQFLPYPGNYGFIPSTYMDPAIGGDGDALDVLVICPSQPTGTVLEVKPIAVLDLKDGGEIDSKIIAVPVDPNLQIIDATTLKELGRNHGMVKKMIRQWFLNYKGKGVMKFENWLDEEAAMESITKWQKGE